MTVPAAPVAGAQVVANPGTPVGAAPAPVAGTPVAGAPVVVDPFAPNAPAAPVPGAPVAVSPVAAAPVAVAQSDDGGSSWLYVITLLLFCGCGIVIGISMSLCAPHQQRIRKLLQGADDSEDNPMASSQSYMAMGPSKSEAQAALHRKAGKKLTSTRSSGPRHTLSGEEKQKVRLVEPDSDEVSQSQNEKNEKIEQKTSDKSDKSAPPRRSMIKRGRSTANNEDPNEDAPEQVVPRNLAEDVAQENVDL